MKFININYIFVITATTFLLHGGCLFMLMPLYAQDNQTDVTETMPDDNTKNLAVEEEGAPQLQKQSSPYINQNPISLYDKIIDQCKKQLYVISAQIINLSSFIHHNQIKTLVDKNTALENLKYLSYQIQMVEREHFVAATKEQASAFVAFNRSVVQHIIRALNAGFKEFPPFESTNRTPTKKMINDQHLLKILSTNEQLLHSLNTKIETVGLHWYNRAYRKIDAHVINPVVKNDLLRLAAYITAGTTAGLSAWWFLYNENFMHYAPLPSFIRNNIFGERPISSWDPYTGTNTISNQDKIGLLYNAEKLIFDLSNGAKAITALCFYYAYQGLSERWNQEWYPKIRKKISIATNTLKGGAYLEEALKVAEITETVKPEDLIGLEDVKQDLDLIATYIADPESFDRAHMSPPKGLLFYGPTRTGKTKSAYLLQTLIEQKCKARGINNQHKFISVSVSMLEAMGIDRFFYDIQSLAPCVVFIDEIDLLYLQRHTGRPNLVNFLSGLGNALCKNDPLNQIIFVGSTNYITHFDNALIAPGRFGKHIYFGYPTYAHRKEFIFKRLNELSLNPQYFDVDYFASNMENQSYEAINSVINAAILRSRIRGEHMSQEHIEQAMRTTIHQILEYSTKQIRPEELNILSAHYAGHALAVELLKTGNHIAYVTIQECLAPIQETAPGANLWNRSASNNKDEDLTMQGKIILAHAHDTAYLKTHQEKLDEIAYLMSGIAAEEILVGSCGHSCHLEDMKLALAYAQSLTFEGIDQKNFSKESQEERHKQTENVIREARQRIKDLLMANEEKLKAIAAILKQQHTLSGHDIQKILFFVDHKDELIAKMEKYQHEHGVPTEVDTTWDSTLDKSLV